MEKLQNKIHTEQGRSVPLVRFPMFKDEWEHKELNELLSESKKKNADLKYSKEEVLSVSGELGIVNQIEHLGRSYAGASVHNYGVVEVGNIVYTKSPLKANPYGIIKINKGKAGIVSTLYAVYKVNSKTAYGNFLDYYFSLDANTNRYLRPLVKKGAKNDMKINNEYVLHDRIFAPSIPEQKRIANFFSVLDNKINQLKEKKALLEEYKKGMMQKIFVSNHDYKDSHENHDFEKEKNQGNQDIQEKSRFGQLRFKDDDGKEFPGWENKKLIEVSTKINSGKTPIGGEKVYVDNGVLFIRSQNVFDNTLSYEKSTYIPESINATMKNSIVKPYDILLNITGGSLGRSCVVPADFKEGNVNQHVCIIRINHLNNPYFIQSYLSTEKGQNRLFSLQTGSGREGLNFQSIKGLKIYFPCLKEQTKIANFLSKIDDKIKTVNEQIEESKEYKKGLLQKMYVV